MLICTYERETRLAYDASCHTSAALPNDATATEFDKDLQLACDSVFAQIGLFHFEQFYYDLYPLIANVCKDN